VHIAKYLPNWSVGQRWYYPINGWWWHHSAEVNRMPPPGDLITAFSVEPGHCFRMVYDHKLQATHCRQPPAWKVVWRDAKGKSSYYQSISSLSCAAFTARTNWEWASCQTSFAESYCLTTSVSSSMGPMSCSRRPKCGGGSFS
jgi:hypothetical protein